MEQGASGVCTDLQTGGKQATQAWSQQYRRGPCGCHRTAAPSAHVPLTRAPAALAGGTFPQSCRSHPGSVSTHPLRGAAYTHTAGGRMSLTTTRQPTSSTGCAHLHRQRPKLWQLHSSQVHFNAQAQKHGLLELVNGGGGGWGMHTLWVISGSQECSGGSVFMHAPSLEQ